MYSAHMTPYCASVSSLHCTPHTQHFTHKHPTPPHYILHNTLHCILHINTLHYALHYSQGAADLLRGARGQGHPAGPAPALLRRRRCAHDHRHQVCSVVCVVCFAKCMHLLLLLLLGNRVRLYFFLWCVRCCFLTRSLQHFCFPFLVVYTSHNAHTQYT